MIIILFRFMVFKSKRNGKQKNLGVHQDGKDDLKMY